MPNYFNNPFDCFLHYFYSLHSSIVDINNKCFFYVPDKQDSSYNINLSSHNNPYDEFFDTIRKNNYKKRKNHLPITSDSIHFQNEIIIQMCKELYKQQTTTKNCFNSKIIHSFLNNKPFKVIACDKNIGSAVISNENYFKISLEHLNDKNTYEIIENNPLEHMC